MASSGWKVINSKEVYGFALGYATNIDNQLIQLKDHPNRYYLVPVYRSYAVQISNLIDEIGKLVAGQTDPATLPPASKRAFYEGTTILKPVDLRKADYRRLACGEFSALYRLEYSENPHVCFGVRVFFREDEPEHLEAALEALYQQIIKRLRG